MSLKGNFDDEYDVPKNIKKSFDKKSRRCCIAKGKKRREQMKKTELEKKLTRLLNEESRESDSNTPDFLLAEFMLNCLDAFELTSNKREVWYGVNLRCEDTEPRDKDGNTGSQKYKSNHYCLS